MISFEHAKLLVDMQEQIKLLYEKFDLTIKHHEEQTTLLMMLVSFLDTEKLKETIKGDKVLSRRLDALGIKL